MSKQIEVQIITSKGNSWSTGFNGSYLEAFTYFYGKRVTSENVETGKETVETIISIQDVTPVNVPPFPGNLS